MQTDYSEKAKIQKQVLNEIKDFLPICIPLLKEKILSSSPFYIAD